MVKRFFFLLLIVFLLGAAPAAADELTLEKAIELALAQSRSVQQAAHERSAADWGLARSVSSYLPRVSYNTAWTRIDDETFDAADEMFELTKRLDPDAEPSVFRDSYSSSLSVLQPIFNGGGEYVAIKAAAIGRKNAHLGEQDARMSVVLEVKQAYYGVMTARALMVVTRESLALARESLRLQRARFEVGSATKSDTLRWEAEAAGAEGAVAEAENAHAQALMQLARAIGGPVAKRWELPSFDEDGVMEKIEAARKIEGAGIDDPLSINNHPAMRQTAGGVKLAGVETEAQVGGLLPNVNFFYNYNWATNDTLGPDEDTNWNMGIAVEIPLLQGLGRVTGIGQTVRAKQQARVGVEQFNRSFLQRAYASKLNLRSARLRVASARKGVAASQANLEIVESRATLGMATSLEQLDARLAYLRGRSDLIGAISDFHIALADWEYVSAQTEE